MAAQVGQYWTSIKTNEEFGEFGEFGQIDHVHNVNLAHRTRVLILWPFAFALKNHPRLPSIGRVDLVALVAHKLYDAEPRYKSCSSQNA